jgi:hypothetical protein
MNHWAGVLTTMNVMSQFNAPGYEVARPTGRCAFTSRPLAPHEPYMATLVEEGDLLRRVDVSMDAWNEGRRPEHMLGYWRAVTPEPDAKKKMFVDDEVLMNLLERLGDADQPQRVAFRFVLALILMRKKLVRYDRTERRPGAGPDGSPQDWWVLTPKADLSKGPLGRWDEGRVIEVLDPHLDEAGVRAVTDQLSEILQAEL